jgi:hypothetical protein
LIFTDAPTLHQRSADLREPNCAARCDYVAALRRRGQLISAEALRPTETAVTVRHEAGLTDVAPSPFAETTAQLSEVYVIDVRDLNEAIRVASQFPHTAVSCIEIRPLREPSTARFINPNNGGAS